MNMKSGFLSIFWNQCWECVMQYELHVVVYTVSYGINGAINVKIRCFIHFYIIILTLCPHYYLAILHTMYVLKITCILWTYIYKYTKNKTKYIFTSILEIKIDQKSNFSLHHSAHVWLSLNYNDKVNIINEWIICP